MKDIRIHFDKHNLFEVALVGMLIYALWTIGDFLLVLGVGLILSTFIEDFVVHAQKYRIPRVVSVIFFYSILVFSLAALIGIVFPILGSEIQTLAESYPEIQTYIQDNSILFSSASSDNSALDFVQQFGDQEFREQFMNRALGFFGGLINVLIIFVVSFYLSVQPSGIDYALRIFTPLKYEEMVVSMWHRVQRKIGSWFRGQLIIALILSILTYAGLALVGVPYAFMLSILAGVFGLVPYGIFIAVIPAVAIGVADSGIFMGVGIVAGYFLLQQILDLGLQPLILKKMTGVPSLVVIISVFIGAKLFGIYGLLLAMPIALFVMELIAESEKHKSQERPPLVECEEIIIDDKKESK